MVPLELPATSIVQVILANQPTLLLSQDHHAVFVLLMTSPEEPSIPHSEHKTEKTSPAILMPVLHDLYSTWVTEPDSILPTRRVLSRLRNASDPQDTPHGLPP